MGKVVKSLLASILALILVSPVIGINQIHYQDASDLDSIKSSAVSRGGEYEVEIQNTNEVEATVSVTRNDQVSISYDIKNIGSKDDAYNLSVSWSDNEGLGWDSQPSVESIFVLSGETKTAIYNFKSPVQGVYSGDYKDFTVTVASQNMSSTSANLQQMLDMDMAYAVDVKVINAESQKNGNRGTTVIYNLEVENVGDNTDNFTIETGELPKDWQVDISHSYVILSSRESATIDLEVLIPSNAAKNEFAVIQSIARVQESGYDYIYGFTSTNTSVNNGLIYSVQITSSDYSRKVIPGGEVYYDLEVENTGDSTDSYTLRLEDVMKAGWESNLSEFEIQDLAPGQTFGLDLIVTSPSDAEENDWYLSTIIITSQTREKFNSSMEANTSVRIPDRSVSLVIVDDSLSGDPGSIIVYSLTLKNTGSDPDDFTFSFEKCSYCNTWNVELSSNGVNDLGPNQEFNFQMNVIVPTNAKRVDFAVISVTATSVSDSSAEAFIVTNSTVNEVFSHQIFWDSSKTLFPGDSSSFEIRIINNGNSYMDFVFDSNEIPNSWDFVVNNVNLPYTTQSLSPYGGEEKITVNFKVPNDANTGEFDFNVIVKHSSSGYQIDSGKFSIIVESYAHFIFSVSNSESKDFPGTVRTFSVDVTNNANEQDEIQLTLDGLPLKWSSRFLSNNGMAISTIKVGSSGQSSFVLEVITHSDDPRNEQAGTELIIQGTSTLNSKVVNSTIVKVFTKAEFGLSVSTSDIVKNVSKGTKKVTFTLTVSSSTNSKEVVNVLPAIVPIDWESTFSVTTFELDQSSLPKNVYLELQLPEMAYGGENIINVQMKSASSGQIIDVNLTVFVSESPSFSVELKTSAGDVVAGEIGKFLILLTNDGNTVENFNLSIEGKRASWFSLSDTVIKLVPGSSREFIVEVKPPISQLSEDTSGTLNVTMSSDISKTTKITLPFTVLKSDLIIDTPTEEEESLLENLPSINLILVIALLSFISVIRRRN